MRELTEKQRRRIIQWLESMPWWEELPYAQLEELKAAAQIIFGVSNKAGIKSIAVECPHGNIPSYPSHAWWCDECFYRLQDALGGGDD